MSVWEQLSKKANDNGWKSVATASTIIGVTITSAILINKYRAQYHDNIPMLATDSWSLIQGHLPLMLSTRGTRLGFHGMLFEEIKKAGFPSICCLSRPPNAHLIFVTNPIHVRYIFDTNFQVTQKSHLMKKRFEELLGDGIFAVNGTEWRFHRKIASRMFSTRNLKNYMYDVSLKSTNCTILKLKNLMNENKAIDMNDLLGRFTLDTFCEIAFGQCINSVSTYPKQHDFGVAFDDMVERIGKRSGDLLWTLKRQMNVGNESYIHQNHIIIKKFVENIINKKNQYSSKMSDETGKESYDILSLYLKHDDTLTYKDLYDISINFIIAGRDTTRMLLSWWIWELCKNENKQYLNKLYKEIDNFQREPTYSDFNQSFKYLEATLCESLRLNPSVPFLGRSCVKDTKLPQIDGENKQYIIRKGDVVLVPNYAMARNKKVWGDNAEQFIPERWTKGLNTFDQYKFSVFNINPRLCLGKNFAIQEAKIFAYFFLKNFKFEMKKNHQVIIKGGAILNMANGLPIILTLRN